MFGKKDKEINWFKTAEKLYRKNKLPAPYGNLFEYYLSVSWVTKRKRHGHYNFFKDAETKGILDDAIKDLVSVLPLHFINNLNEAYEKYSALGDNPEYEDIEILDIYDDYTFDNEEEIAAILSDYIRLSQSL